MTTKAATKGLLIGFHGPFGSGKDTLAKAILKAAFLPEDPKTRRILLEVFAMEQGLRAMLRAVDEGHAEEVPLLLATLGSLKDLEA